MDTQENKKLVTRLLSKLGTDDLPGIAELLHDDLEWWAAGKHFVFGGTIGKAKAMATFKQFSEMFPQGLILTPVTMVAEGDRVAVEVSGHGITPAGRSYDNEYHFSFVIKDGKVHRVREYHDTQYAKMILLDH